MLKKAIPLFLAAILALTGVVGFVVYHNVQADATKAAVVLPSRGGPDQERGFGGFTDEDLATALGIDVTSLQTAKKTAADEALQQAVDQGLITQEQADQMKERGDGSRGFGGPEMMRGDKIDYETLLAKALGISADELKAAYSQAANAALDRAVANGDLTADQANLSRARAALAGSEKFQSDLKAAYEAALKAAVSDGVITQEQADLLMKEDGAAMPGGFFGPGGWGGPGGRHSFGGPDGAERIERGGNPPSAPVSSTPTD